MATDFQRLIEALVQHQTEFVIIGGVALVLHGSSRVTQDLDICYSREPENLERLVKALGPFHPSLRGAPSDLPFLFDARTLRSGLNFTLSVEAGDIDLLGEVTGVGRFQDIAVDAKPMDIYGMPVLVMSLSALERAKRAAGRLKDITDLAEIEEIRRRSIEG